MKSYLNKQIFALLLQIIRYNINVFLFLSSCQEMHPVFMPSPKVERRSCHILKTKSYFLGNNFHFCIFEDIDTVRERKAGRHAIFVGKTLALHPTE